MMPRLTPASEARAALQRRRDTLAGIYQEPDRKPRTLTELQWRIDRDGTIHWNGGNALHFEPFIGRNFRALPGPMPGRFAYSSDQRSARSSEIRSRNKIAGEILRTAIAWDRSLTNEEFPPALPTSAALTEYARLQDLEISHTAELLHIEFADEFWTRLSSTAREQFISADAVCDWIGERTERWLAGNGGEWPAWAHLPLAVAA